MTWSRKRGGDQTSLQCQHIKICNLFNQEVKTNFISFLYQENINIHNNYNKDNSNYL